MSSRRTSVAPRRPGRRSSVGGATGGSRRASTASSTGTYFFEDSSSEEMAESAEESSIDEHRRKDTEWHERKQTAQLKEAEERRAREREERAKELALALETGTSASERESESELSEAHQDEENRNQPRRSSGTKSTGMKVKKAPPLPVVSKLLSQMKPFSQMPRELWSTRPQAKPKTVPRPPPEVFENSQASTTQSAIPTVEINQVADGGRMNADKESSTRTVPRPPSPPPEVLETSQANVTPSAVPAVDNPQESNVRRMDVDFETDRHAIAAENQQEQQQAANRTFDLEDSRANKRKSQAQTHVNQDPKRQRIQQGLEGNTTLSQTANADNQGHSSSTMMTSTPYPNRTAKEPSIAMSPVTPDNDTQPSHLIPTQKVKTLPRPPVRDQADVIRRMAHANRLGRPTQAQSDTEGRKPHPPPQGTHNTSSPQLSGNRDDAQRPLNASKSNSSNSKQPQNNTRSSGTETQSSTEASDPDSDDDDNGPEVFSKTHIQENSRARTRSRSPAKRPQQSVGNVPSTKSANEQVSTSQRKSEQRRRLTHASSLGPPTQVQSDIEVQNQPPVPQDNQLYTVSASNSKSKERLPSRKTATAVEPVSSDTDEDDPPRNVRKTRSNAQAATFQPKPKKKPAVVLRTAKQKSPVKAKSPTLPLETSDNEQSNEEEEELQLDTEVQKLPSPPQRQDIQPDTTAVSTSKPKTSLTVPKPTVGEPMSDIEENSKASVEFKKKLASATAKQGKTVQLATSPTPSPEAETETEEAQGQGTPAPESETTWDEGIDEEPSIHEHDKQMSSKRKKIKDDKKAEMAASISKPKEPLASRSRKAAVVVETVADDDADDPPRNVRKTRSNTQAASFQPKPKKKSAIPPSAKQKSPVKSKSPSLPPEILDNELPDVEVEEVPLDTEVRKLPPPPQDTQPDTAAASTSKATKSLVSQNTAVVEPVIDAEEASIEAIQPKKKLPSTAAKQGKNAQRVKSPTPLPEVAIGTQPEGVEDVEPRAPESKKKLATTAAKQRKTAQRAKSPTPSPEALTEPEGAQGQEAPAPESETTWDEGINAESSIHESDTISSKSKKAKGAKKAEVAAPSSQSKKSKASRKTAVVVEPESDDDIAEPPRNVRKTRSNAQASSVQHKSKKKSAISTSAKQKSPVKAKSPTVPPETLDKVLSDVEEEEELQLDTEVRELPPPPQDTQLELDSEAAASSHSKKSLASRKPAVIVEPVQDDNEDNPPRSMRKTRANAQAASFQPKPKKRQAAPPSAKQKSPKNAKTPTLPTETSEKEQSDVEEKEELQLDTEVRNPPPPPQDTQLQLDPAAASSSQSKKSLASRTPAVVVEPVPDDNEDDPPRNVRKTRANAQAASFQPKPKKRHAAPPSAKQKSPKIAKTPTLPPETSDKEQSDVEEEEEEQLEEPQAGSSGSQLSGSSTRSRERSRRSTLEIARSSSTTSTRPAMKKSAPRGEVTRYVGNDVFGNYHMLPKNKFLSLLNQERPDHGLDDHQQTQLAIKVNHFLEDLFTQECEDTNQPLGFVPFSNLKKVLVDQCLLEEDATGEDLLEEMKKAFSKEDWKRSEKVLYPSRYSRKGNNEEYLFTD